MATTTDTDLPVFIKTEDKDTDADSLTANINMLKQSEIVQLPPNLLGDQASLSLIGGGNGPKVSKHLNTYMCGSCGSQFNDIYAIVDLHTHVQIHGLGGSYYYNHRSRTAYPKYDSVCSETQTATLFTMKLKLKAAKDKVSSGRESNQVENNQPESGVDVYQLNRKRQLRKRKNKTNTIYDNSTGFIKKRTRSASKDENCLRELFDTESSHAESTVKEPFTMSKSMCSEWTVVEQLESNGSGTETVDVKEFDTIEQYIRSSELGPGTQPELKVLECKRACNVEFNNAVGIDSVIDLQETNPFKHELSCDDSSHPDIDTNEETESVDLETNPCKPEATLASQSDSDQVDSDSCYPDVETKETGTVEQKTDPCKSKHTHVSQRGDEQPDMCGSSSFIEFDVGALESNKGPEEVKHVPESTEKQTKVEDSNRIKCKSESEVDTKSQTESTERQTEMADLDINTLSVESQKIISHYSEIQCSGSQQTTYQSELTTNNGSEEVKHVPESTGKQTEITDLDRNTGQSGLATNSDKGCLHNRINCIDDSNDGIGGSNGNNRSGRPKRNARKREYKTYDITPEKKVKTKVQHWKKNKVIQVTMPIRTKKKSWRGPRRRGKGRFVSAETVQTKDNFFKVIKKIHLHTCFKCRLVFHNEDHLKIHMKKHFGSFICECCNKSFKSINKLQEHLIEEGKPMKAVKIFVCSVCGLIITELRGLVAHLCTSTEENGLRKQVVRMYTDKIVNPTEDITEVVTLKDAPLDNMETRLQCETCHLGFENEYFLTMHSVVHSHTKKCRCRLCFMTDVDFKLHKLSCEDRSAFKCKECGKEFARKSNLKQHEMIHKENAICDKCGMTLSTPAGLSRHITSSCPGLKNRDRVTCAICSKTFRGKRTLKQHTNSVHLDIRPFICEICGSGFHLSANLKRHVLTHQKDRQPSRCDICGASMSERSLDRHMKLHTRQPKFTCEICGKQFAERWNMKAHMRQHTGDKPYKCGKCSEGFAHNVSRKNHMKKCCKVVADAK